MHWLPHSKAGVESQDVGIEMHDKDDEGDASAGSYELNVKNEADQTKNESSKEESEPSTRSEEI